MIVSGLSVDGQRHLCGLLSQLSGHRWTVTDAPWCSNLTSLNIIKSASPQAQFLFYYASVAVVEEKRLSYTALVLRNSRVDQRLADVGIVRKERQRSDGRH